MSSHTMEGLDLLLSYLLEIQKCKTHPELLASPVYRWHLSRTRWAQLATLIVEAGVLKIQKQMRRFRRISALTYLVV